MKATIVERCNYYTFLNFDTLLMKHETWSRLLAAAKGSTEHIGHGCGMLEQHV